MRVLDLFSGIGGFSLGLGRAGMQTVAFCEIDPYCRKVLAKHWRVPCYDDIRTLTAARLAADGIIAADVADADAQNGWHAPAQPAGSGETIRTRAPQSGGRHIDLICGGFPCQDISSAGRGAGIDGERSGLWREMARVIGEVRPHYAIIENVSALLVRGLGRVLGDLAALGYDAEWHCIPAAAVGAPHRRDRIWIVGYPHGEGSVEGRGEERLQVAVGGGRGDDDVADAIGAGLEGRPRLARYLAAELAAIERGGAGNGLSAVWLVEPDVGGSSDGLPQWLDRYIGWGLSHAESQRRNEVLRQLWNPVLSAALRRAAGGLERLSQAEVLFSFLREYEAGSDEARLLVAGKEASENFLRGLRDHAIAGSASYRSKQGQQRAGEYPDAVQSLSRLLACDGEASWAGGGWEDATPRVAHGVPKRVDRLRALGNAVVPQLPELIGRAIMNDRMAVETRPA